MLAGAVLAIAILVHDQPIIARHVVRSRVSIVVVLRVAGIADPTGALLTPSAVSFGDLSVAGGIRCCEKNQDRGGNGPPLRTKSKVSHENLLRSPRDY